MKNTEIEHKFLIRNESFRALATHVYSIRQGYLCTDPERTIRIRQKDDKAFITIKSKPDSQTLARFEWEREIDLLDAQEIFRLCLPNMIDKERYIVPWKGCIIEVDIFHGVNEGLKVAEIELQAIGQQLPELPDFIGEEVSYDYHYTNSYLATKPYSTWS